MMKFAEMWGIFAVGDELTVSDGTAEPSEAGVRRNEWRSHNFTGTIQAKLSNTTPRQVVIRRVNSLGNQVEYTIVEGSVDRFDYSESSPLPAARWGAETDINAAREAALTALLTDGAAVKLAYMMKADEVKRANGVLPAVLNALGVADREVLYPMAHQESLQSGETLSAVLARFKAGYLAAVKPFARTEGKAQVAKRAAKVAVSVAKANEARSVAL